MNEIAERFLTHRVENQPPPLPPYDAWLTDRPLRDALVREGGGWAEEQLAAFGPVVGGELMMLGVAANENKPRFVPFDRYGHRIDAVRFDPAYHAILSLGIRHEVPSFAWRNASRRGAHVARAALAYLHNQPEQGNNCPLTMTYASVAALRRQGGLADAWIERILSTEYDPRDLPAWHKTGNTIGMGMTEKQGGSDVRANTTRATPIEAPGQARLYALVGHKWFFSAPMCDGFLVLAQADAGLSCFLLPRFAPDGSRNAIRLQRLKDKLGDWSNASSEVEFQGAAAWLIGEEGRGVATILDMVALTRLDCTIGSAAIMRQALVQALHHTMHRRAFGKRLVDQALMRNVLADLALESEASMALALRVARAVDDAQHDPQAAPLARLITAIGKYAVCKRCAPFVNEAQECLGGAGYVEESMLPRLYRQAPLNSIWEGSGNVQCLDVLRTLDREPASPEAFLGEIDRAAPLHPLLREERRRLGDLLATAPAEREALARVLVERMAVALQAAVLLLGAPEFVADAFCRARLGGRDHRCFGTLPAGAPFGALIDRAWPDAVV